MKWDLFDERGLKEEWKPFLWMGTFRRMGTFLMNGKFFDEWEPCRWMDTFLMNGNLPVCYVSVGNWTLRGYCSNMIACRHHITHMFPPYFLDSDLYERTHFSGQWPLSHEANTGNAKHWGFRGCRVMWARLNVMLVSKRNERLGSNKTDHTQSKALLQYNTTKG